MPLKKRFLTTFDLRCNISRTKILYENTLEHYTATFQSTRKHHHDDGCRSDTDHQCTGKSRKEIAYIENECHSDGYTYENGKSQWETIKTALRPKRLKLFTMIFLHYHRPKKRSNEPDGQHTAHAIGPPMRKNMPNEWQKESKHQCNHGRAQNGKDHNIKQ